jgi:hypothetical protein
LLLLWQFDLDGGGYPQGLLLQQRLRSQHHGHQSFSISTWNLVLGLHGIHHYQFIGLLPDDY